MRNRGNRLTISIDSIQLMLATLIVLWLSAGNSTFIVGRIPNVIKLGIVFIWFILATWLNKYYLYKFLKVSWPMILFVMIIFLSSVIGNTDYYTLYFQNYLYILILLALFAYYFYFGTLRALKVIIATYLLDTIIVSARTFVELFRNPILVRAISTGGELKQTLLDGVIPNGIGGYGFCYVLVFLMALLLFYRSILGKYSWLRLLLCGFVLLLLFQTQITLALIMYVAIWTVSIIASKTNNRSQMIRKVVCVIGILTIMLNFTSILEWAISLAEESLADRLKEVLNFIQSSGTEVGPDIGSRLRLYTLSLDTFIDNPLFGSWGNRAYGCHSTVLDALAAFGIFGFFGIYGIAGPLFRAKRKLQEHSVVTNEISSEKYLTLLTLVFFSLSCVNISHTNDIMVAVILITPLVLKLHDCFWFSEDTQ